MLILNNQAKPNGMLCTGEIKWNNSESKRVDKDIAGNWRLKILQHINIRQYMILVKKWIKRFKNKDLIHTELFIIMICIQNNYSKNHKTKNL